MAGSHPQTARVDALMPRAANAIMRTCDIRLPLDTDIAQHAKALSPKTGRTFKEIVNRALRSGLRDEEQPLALKPYRTRPPQFGSQPGI